MYICDRLADLCIYSVSRRGGGVGGEVRGGFGGNRHDTFCFDSALILYSK